MSPAKTSLTFPMPVFSLMNVEMQNHSTSQHVFQRVKGSLPCVESSGPICFGYDHPANFIPTFVVVEKPRSRCK